METIFGASALVIAADHPLLSGKEAALGGSAAAGRRQEEGAGGAPEAGGLAAPSHRRCVEAFCEVRQTMAPLRLADMTTARPALS